MVVDQVDLGTVGEIGRVGGVPVVDEVAAPIHRGGTIFDHRISLLVVGEHVVMKGQVVGGRAAVRSDEHAPAALATGVGALGHE